MKFLVDAHLPKKLARWLQTKGHDAVHTLDLPDKNATTDAEINRISVGEQRIVITKDADFVNSFLVSNQPHKLLLISTGNISNTNLQNLIERNFEEITNALEQHAFVELSSVTITIHQ